MMKVERAYLSCRGPTRRLPGGCKAGLESSFSRRTDREEPAGHRGSDDVLVFRTLCDLFSRYLASRPLAHAFFRAAECGELSDLIIRRPVLDLGCGDGEFARFALQAAPDVGVDLRADRLIFAKRLDPSVVLARADARRLPFVDGSFASVLAVSVLEHVDEPWEALREIARVLLPGGRFIATIVLADLHQHLFHKRWLRPLGLAGAYIVAHDVAFQHRCLLDRADWSQMLSNVGLNVVESRKIVGPRIIAAFDLLLATAWPYRLTRGTKADWLWRPKWISELCWKLYQQLAADGEDPRSRDDEDGSVLLVVAEKQG
jgi:SAM-dependent methyltransferase